MVGHLPIKLGRPAPRNRRAAGWALPFRGQAILLDEITVAPNEREIALMAARVFQIADHARQISRINILQARLLADLRGAQ